MQEADLNATESRDARRARIRERGSGREIDGGLAMMAGNRRGTENIAYLPYKGRLSRPKTKRIPTLCPPPSDR